MVKITAQRGEVEAYVMELIADTLEDIANIKTQYNKVAAGSTCICIENSSVWILGGDNEWHEL